LWTKRTPQWLGREKTQQLVDQEDAAVARENLEDEGEESDDDDDGPCVILDTSDEEATAMFMAAIEKGYRRITTAGTTLAATATTNGAVRSEGDKEPVGSSSNRRGCPWIRAAQWLRHKQDLAL
jgi:hypothetical protein